MKLLKPAEVAEILSCRPGTVYKWASLGLIPGAVKLHGLLRFHESEIRAWIAGQTEEFRKKTTESPCAARSRIRKSPRDDEINSIIRSVIESSRPVRV